MKLPIDEIYKRTRARLTKKLDKLNASQHPLAKILAAGPELFMLLTRLVRDPRVPLKQKAKLAAALAYFVSPIDLLPAALVGPMGLADDIAFAAYALHSVINEIDPEILREHWHGDDDALAVIQSVLAESNRLLGSGIWGKLARRFGRKPGPSN